MAEVRLHVKADVSPTESQEKVEKAIKNVLGPLPLKVVKKRGYSRLETEVSGVESLRKLREGLARERIRDAARAMLTRWSARREKVSFTLNRQAAYAGHLSLYQAAHAPLGPIEVEVDGEPDRVIEFLTGKASD
jgi:predicted RNA binding protein with dsRBD fold (UPF0201 family)